ncbi:MAG: imidazole glycerol phosphate synthase subunit HisH, partial [Francisellaceae bacterium]
MTIIAIIDCCGSNYTSIKQALERLGARVRLTHNIKTIAEADFVILPGVGHAAAAMAALKHHGLDVFIPGLRQPVLGICLGMQLLYSFSEEGQTPALSIIPGVIKEFDRRKGLVPHMGWNTIESVSPEPHFLLDGVLAMDCVYYVHGFYAPVSTETIAINDYIQPFSAMVEKDNFYGVERAQNNFLFFMAKYLPIS